MNSVRGHPRSGTGRQAVDEGGREDVVNDGACDEAGD